MTEENTKSEKKKLSSTFLDVLTGKIGKITGLILAGVALLLAVQQLAGEGQKIYQMWAPVRGVDQKECFKPEIDVKPTTVSVKEWNSVKFRMTGRNNCKETLSIHVAFKAKGDTIRIEPPFKGMDQSACKGYENPTCWEQNSIDQGKDVDWILTPPFLRRNGQLVDPVKVAINWTVYNREKTLVRAGKAEMTVLGDGQP